MRLMMPPELHAMEEAGSHSLQMGKDLVAQVVDDAFAQFECQSLAKMKGHVRPGGQRDKARDAPQSAPTANDRRSGR